VEWVEVPPFGTVWSYATYHRSLDPRLDIPVPYAVLAVELPAGVVLPGRFRGDLGDLRIGLPVEAVFAPLGGGDIGPLWTVGGTGGSSARRAARGGKQA
jgi:uncharacterized OB-fold protein